MMKVTAIIVAAGSGRRMGAAENKVWLSLGGQPVLAWSVAAFAAVPEIAEIVIVAQAAELARVRQLAADFSKVRRVVAGGATRQESVAQGLAAATGAYAAIHDAARPLIAPELIRALCQAAATAGAAIPALPVTDTIKEVTDGLVTATPARERLMAAQTPQVFDKDRLQAAYAQAAAVCTDDAALWEQHGWPLVIVPGDRNNFKLTTPQDLLLARAIVGDKMAEKKIRIGIGYDVHRLVEGRPLVLGGVQVDHPLGLLGHSDADALCHAIADALLGAANLGDLGKHFPDNDPQYKDVSSLWLLEQVAAKLTAAGWQINNVDSIIIAQKPKLAPHTELMQEKVAAALGVAVDQVSIKATTTEYLGFCGAEEGIAAQATALLAGK